MISIERADGNWCRFAFLALALSLANSFHEFVQCGNRLSGFIHIPAKCGSSRHGLLSSVEGGIDDRSRKMVCV
ncbi:MULTISPECIES: hypothetical protein, partial [unclassified Mesorhizobium]|uniref:hypothetical protein n=1 Tax=unclassified Mesorhizobium TaxID=325217 RepID=UPI0019D4DD2C